MKSVYLILFTIVVILFSLEKGSCQRHSINRNNKSVNYWTLHYINPNTTGKKDLLSTSLSKSNQLLLTGYSVKNGISVGYFSSKTINNYLIDKFDGGLQLRYLSGAINYRQRGATIGSGSQEFGFVEERAHLDFKNIFLGTSIKFRKSLFKKDFFDLIVGIDLAGRIFNNTKLKVDFYTVDNANPDKLEKSNSGRPFSEENLIFLQSNILAGFSLNPIILKNLSIECLFSYASIPIHNAGRLRVNPIFLGIRYQI